MLMYGSRSCHVTGFDPGIIFYETDGDGSATAGLRLRGIAAAPWQRRHWPLKPDGEHERIAMLSNQGEQHGELGSFLLECRVRLWLLLSGMAGSS